MITLYGIPNCDTVKKARTFLAKHSLHYEFVDFKKTPPTLEDIERWEKVFGGLPVNTKGQTYKKHASIYEKLKPAQQKEFIIANSSMIKRPILQKNKQVLCFGFDEKEFTQKLGV